jgi:hypothetical protein
MAGHTTQDTTQTEAPTEERDALAAALADPAAELQRVERDAAEFGLHQFGERILALSLLGAVLEEADFHTEPVRKSSLMEAVAAALPAYELGGLLRRLGEDFTDVVDAWTDAHGLYIEARPQARRIPPAAVRLLASALAAGGADLGPEEAADLTRFLRTRGVRMPEGAA